MKQIFNYTIKLFLYFLNLFASYPLFADQQKFDISGNERLAKETL